MNFTVIDSKDFKKLTDLIENVQATNLCLLKKMDELAPARHVSSVPDYISLQDARNKYHVSAQTLYNKFKLFKHKYGREIDRIQSGSYKLINELELLETLKLKSEFRGFGG